MQESDIKYLAGLFDADGSCSIRFNKNNRLHIRLQIAASDAVSRNHEILYWLKDTFGGVVNHHATLRNSTVKVWVMQSRRELELLIPRLVKHLVIKGSSLAGTWNLYKVYGGRPLEDHEVQRIKEHQSIIRKLNGPVKPKNHPTWAWVAGYIDGDGCLFNRYYAKYRSHHMRVVATAHVNDLCGLNLLQKAFGGDIRLKSGSDSVYVWSRNLGYRDSSFAVKFLRKLVRHLKIKRYKAEQILANHSQRLSVSDPTG